jgi:APA family basic amino acid/polyamine antiporter
LVFFAFIGFDEVITLAEETRHPTHTVPAALFLALGISMLLYMGVAVAAVSVLGANVLGASERPLADVVGHAIGTPSAGFVALLAMVSTVKTTLLAVTAASRVLYGLAVQRALPVAWSVLHPGRRTPLRAIVLVALGAAALVLMGDLTLVASVTDVAVYLVFLVVHSTVVVLRFRRPDLPREFRGPPSVGRLPLLPLLGFASVLLMLTRLPPTAIGLGVAVTALGPVTVLVMHWGPQRRRNNTPDRPRALSAPL